ncbi:DUF2243 domain-containing protein [Alcanivorax quisquiliarum]|uniref:DUF2243 domain-containing protein n=1 Tax=Alcanivorax quisquiliarum TaxID=2933565 RepID=A0ABT0E812_9GAMM|nr:DUF2243 domain-containing protein [Alcanivorax quisquiliarum]MCK0537982.1 DUF2243 domain-containing protein [Alcanivorax quisquiliarum]
MNSNRPVTYSGRKVLTPSWRAAALVGAGMMAAVDEIVFHQILQWHHFYDRGTPALGLLADGLLHALELMAIAGGGCMLLALARRHALHGRAAWSGLLSGAGAFQLFDGIVVHKLLRLHQVRYGVDLFWYDLTWCLSGLLLLLAGLWLLARAKRVQGR